MYEQKPITMIEIIFFILLTLMVTLVLAVMGLISFFAWLWDTAYEILVWILDDK